MLAPDPPLRTFQSPRSPNVRERLLRVGLIGSLSTHSQKFPGFPFGSMMPYAADHLGRPIFFISSMAMHTQNLRQDPRASLLITQPDVSGDPLGAARLTLLGDVTEAPAAEVQRTLSFTLRERKVLAGLHRLCVLSAAGLGGLLHRRLRRHGMDLGRTTTERALPDPLAEAAPGIIRHMNNDHADALRLIARRFAGEVAGRSGDHRR